jgi:hypothetical protein
MNERAWKWVRRALGLSVAAVVLFGVVLVSDVIWYRTQIPVGFYNANWTGTWQTKVWGSFSGRLLVRLPDPLPQNEEFKAEALVYYPIYFGWKPGQFVKMDFTGRFSPDGTATSGETTNRIDGGENLGKFKEKGGKPSFKGIAGDQTVDYTAILTPSKTRMIGAYLSQGPYDYGFFSMRYY